MSATPAPTRPDELAASAGLLRTLLAISPVGIMVLRPLYAGADAATISDFAWVQLNPAAQQQLGLPECPAESFLTLFPTAREAGVFGFYRDAFLSGQVARRDNLYQFDGLDGYYRLVAQRHEDVLLVNFTDTNDQARTAVEEALRASQAREQQATAIAEQERANLVRVFEHASVAIGLFRGPEHLVELANEEIGHILNRPAAPLVGRPIFEAAPDLRAQGLEALMDSTYRDGVPHDLREVPVLIQRPGSERPSQGYFNISYRPQYDGQGQRSGVACLAMEVTDQVLARQQAEQANQELEARVQERTRQLQAQQALLGRILGQVPAAVATLSGPEHRYSFFNAQYQRLVYDQVTLGRSVAEDNPEAGAQGFVALLDQVYQTGQPYVGNELFVELRPAGGASTGHHLNFVYHPLRDDQGQVNGILVFAVDVTEAVEARRQNATLQAGLLTAAQAQVQAREMFYQVFAQTPAAICIQRGPEHRYEYVNAAYRHFFPGRELLGQSMAAAVPETVDNGLLALLDQVYRTGETYYGYEVPVALTQPDGSVKQEYVNFTYQPYRENGEVVGIFTFAYDVAELVRAKQAREAQRRELQSLFAQAPMALVVLRGPQFLIEQANAQAEVIWGVQAADVLGRPHFEAIPGSAGQGFEEMLTGVLQTGEAVVLREVPIELARDHTGRPNVGYYNVIFKPLFDEGLPQATGIVVMWTEHTDQVLARRLVQAQEQRLRALFAQAPAAIFVLRGPDYVFEVVNESMGQMLGMDPAAMLGKGYFELLPALEAQGYRQLLDRVYQTGREYVTQEQAARLPHHAAGETGYYNFTYVPLREADGCVSGIMCVAVDVTAQVLTRRQVQTLNEELTATNEDLHESNRQLTRTNVDLDTFVYTASHDLKAPITNIESITQALRETLPAEARQDEMVLHLLDLLEQTTARFQFTIAQLTDLSKLQLAHAGPAEPVALAAVVEGVRLDLAPVIVAADARLTVEVVPALHVSFSPGNLRSIVYNLLSNAIKYRHPDRPAQVRVRAYPAGPRVVLEVQDNGLGLSEHQQSRLFGLFQRLHTHVEGTGVGLYITKRLVENGGGTIAVESTPGVGTTFAVTFPA